jgi:purine nucleoside phosphorylase
MTASSEAIVMKEAGVPYGCLGVVTNLGCGLASGSLDHSEVVDVMKTKGQAVVDIFLRAVSLV